MPQGKNWTKTELQTRISALEKDLGEAQGAGNTEDVKSLQGQINRFQGMLDREEYVGGKGYNSE